MTTPHPLSPQEHAILAAAPFNLDREALDWVATTRARLSPQQKLRQLFNHGLHGDDLQAARDAAAWGLGAYTRFVGPDLEAAWHATRALLEAADVPPLISGDLEGGAIAMPFGSRLPNQLGLAAMGEAALAKQAVEVIAREARALGYNWSFTPVVDINAAFRSAIVATRSYGSDRDTVLNLARDHVAALQQHGIAATAKHWPGEGFDDRDQHLVTTLNPLERAQWEHQFGRNYRQLIEDGVLAVMAGHIAWPAYARAQGAEGLEACRPASVSRLLNTGLLRGELGFNGLIVSDASGMGGLSAWAPRPQLVADLFNSGCDMLLFPSPFDADLAHLEQALETGLLPWTRIEEALLRVLGLKAALGLHRKSLDERLPPLAQARAMVRSAAHLDTERRAASASITLVKDVQGLLPLSPERHRRIVLVSDPDRSGFAFQSPPPLLLPELLRARGFEVRAFDPEQAPNPDDTDLVLYLLAQESLLTRSHIYLDWPRLHGSFRTSMKRYWHDIPCALVSLGHPYYLYDAPRMPCVVNAYCATPAVQEAVLRKLLGEEAFTGTSPVDASCGLPDALY
jgi:beta-N-acetylhexosaminidase